MPESANPYSQAELEAEGLTDFRVFLWHVWEYLKIPLKTGGFAEPTPVQNDIAHNLQHAPRRFILQAFRGVGKSWITVAFVLWNLLLDPEKKIIVVSASQQLADDFSKFCQQLIHGMPLLHHLAPRDGQRASAISFDVGPATASKDPSVKSAGITGQITGSRADLIVADDIEVQKNAYTHLLRERLAQLVKEFDAILKPGGRIVYLGTPQIEASLYNRLAKDRGYTIRIWPAEIPERPERYMGRLAPYIENMIARGAPAGTPVDPKRFDRADLDERRLSYGPAGYALQFMLDTSPSDAEKHPLKLSDLIVMDVDPDVCPVKVSWARSRETLLQDLAAGGLEGDVYYGPMWRSPEMTSYSGCAMYIDPSGRGNDETGYAIVRFSHGQLYWVASGGFRDGFAEDTLRALAAKAGRHKVTVVLIEENYGGGMFNSLIAPHLAKYGISNINPDDYDGWSKGQKELRILDVLTPVFKSHRLVVDRAVIEEDLKQQADDARYSVVQQITRIHREKGALPNEDRLEALAGACGYFTDRLDRDQQRLLETHRQELLEDELREFIEFATGSPVGTSRFSGRRL